MVDLSSIKDYVDKPDSFMESFVLQEVTNLGVEEFLNYCYNHLDCSRISNTGLRLMQTIGCPYRRSITEFIYTVDTFIEENSIKDEWFNKLIKRHNDNIEYEKINPPIWYGGDKAKSSFEKSHGKSTKSKRKRHIQTSIDFPDTPKKQTAAEKKLAARVAKINALSFKIKPQN